MVRFHEIGNAIITRVRGNDPAVIKLCTRFVTFTDEMAHSLGRALPHSDHVSHLHFSIDALTENGDYFALLLAIEESSTLQEIKFFGSFPNRRVDLMGRVADRFLNAVSFNNNSIKKVILNCIEGMGNNSFLSLLRSRTVSDLEIESCSFSDSSERAYGEIAAEFRANRSLQSLSLGFISNELLIASLNALRSHPKLQRLKVFPYNGNLHHPISRNAKELLIAAVGSILSSPSELKSLYLRHFRFSDEMFHPIANGLRANQNVTSLEFTACRFDNDSTESFVDLLQNNHRIRTLRLAYSVNFHISRGTVVSRILQSNAGLENLILSYQGNIDINLVFKALEDTTTVKTLELQVHSDRELESLCLGLPNIRGLKKLKLVLQGPVRNVSTEALLRAFERNGSLVEVEIAENHRGRYVFDEHALAKIRSFCQRNKKLPALFAAPVQSTERVATVNSDDETSVEDGQHAFSDLRVNLRLRPNAYLVAQPMDCSAHMIFRDLIRLRDLVGQPGTNSTMSNSKLGKR